MVHCQLIADPMNCLIVQRLISQLLTEADGVDVARIQVDPTLGDRKHFGRSVNSVVTYLRDVAELASQITANISIVDEGVVLPPPMQQGEQRELELAMLRLANHHIIQPREERRIDLGNVLGLNASSAEQSPAFVRAAAFDMNAPDVERWAASLNNAATPLDEVLFDLSLKSVRAASYDSTHIEGRSERRDAVRARPPARRGSGQQRLARPRSAAQGRRPRRASICGPRSS